MCKGQEEREKEKENGNAELKSRAANEIKNVLANFHKERQIGFAWKRRKGGVWQTSEKKRSMDGGIPSETEHRCAYSPEQRRALNDYTNIRG